MVFYHCSKENFYKFRPGETLRLRMVHVVMRRKRRAVHTKKWVKQDEKTRRLLKVTFHAFFLSC